MERKSAPLRVILVAALSLGAGSLGTLALQKLSAESPLNGQTQIQKDFLPLKPIEQSDISSKDEFIRLFDEIFSRYDSARLTSRRADTPDLFAQNVFVAESYVGSPEATRISMRKGILYNPGVPVSEYRMMTIELVDSSNPRELFHEQFIGTEITSLREYDQNQWRGISRALIGHFNGYVQDHNGMVQMRADFERDPVSFRRR